MASGKASRKARGKARGKASRTPRSTITKAAAVIAAIAAVVAGAVVATGYDAQKVDDLETSVWVTRAAGQYARVDTDLAQIDTVRDAEDPTGVVQSGSTGIVYTAGFQRMWQVDPADPRALVESKSGSRSGSPSGSRPGAEVGSEGASGEATPSGTREVVSSGEWTVYLTDRGRVYVARIGTRVGSDTAAGADPRPVEIDPLEGTRDASGAPAAPAAKDGTAAAEGYAASAVSVADDGRVALYSAAEKSVRQYDAATSQFVGGVATLTDAPAADAGVALTIVGDRWVLAAPSVGRVWVAGRGESTALGDAALGADTVAQVGASRGDRAYFADSAGLVSVRVTDGTAERITAASGTPAAPTRVDGVVYAAWLGSAAGTLWSATAGASALDVPAGQLDQVQNVTPVIATNGRRAVLNETRTGLLWTIPDGTVIPLSQWSAQDDRDVRQEGTVQVQDVAQQEPPVAEPDDFGVRAGALVALPVLLNDHDPNKRDVLTVDPASVSTGLADSGFGRLALANNDQQILARIQADSGSATFTYAVSDGQALSPPASVRLTVVPDDVNTAPVWCGVSGCLQRWPTASVAPGGTVTIPVLDGWVDPEGDPIALAAATKDDPSAPLTVLPTADGRLAIRHGDPNAAGASYTVTVTVMDSRGAATTKELTVSVSANPPLEVDPLVVVAGIGQERTVAIRDHVRGGSGSSRLVDAVTAGASPDGVSVVANVSTGTISLSASAAGDYAIGYTVQDAQTEGEQTGTLRFRVAAEAGALALPPLTAFVRANEDTTLDILGAVQNISGRVLALASATTADPLLSVSVVEGAQLRLSGTTATGRPGTVGTATVTVTDNAGNTGSGTVTVFLVDPATGVGPIAVPDAVTVRAGAQLDIPVTDNDIAPRGERIVVHPRVEVSDPSTGSGTGGGSGAEGELAFVAGPVVRYLAPSAPGSYTLRYSVYLDGDPSRLDSAAVSITVLAPGENRAPEPRTLVARVAAGSTVVVPVASSGMDPDGDATALVGVEQPNAGAGAVTIGADGGSISYTAPAGGIDGGQVAFAYTLRDGQGGEGRALVRIGILGGQLADVAPITYSDAVRAVVGSGAPLTVRPLANDRDPARGVLELVDLQPNAPEGSAEFERLRRLIEPGTDLADGTVRVRAGDIQGVQSYVYTARSKATSSTAQGLIVVTVAAVAAPDQPVVADTVVTIADRARLATGIDVVTGKASWASGDIGRLTLAVWGDAADRYSASGSRILGPAPTGGALVPFSLSGDDGTGRVVVAYGFLRIPAFDDMRVQLAPGLAPSRVGEEASVSIGAPGAVQVGDGDRIEVRVGEAFAVQRANASCTPSGSTDAVYQAGRGSPWTDSCTIAVRVVGQQTWTLLPIPLVIEPRSPQAVLGSISRTIAPGQSQTIDLYRDMTTWEGGRVGDASQLDYRVGFSGGDFAVEQAGTAVTITARADAHPGARQSAAVSVSGFGGLTSTLALIVGVAPADAPRGATFSQTCTVSSGPSCTVTVVGVPGEYDPFEGKTGAGLKVVGVGDSGCSAARVSVSGGTAITATWPSAAKPAGGSCRVPYTVADAQGRTGAGTLTFDVQGYPPPPRSITTAAYTGSSVTLLVSLGEAANAYPSLRGVAIYENGTPTGTTCAPAAGGTYSCTITGLANGQRHSYTARAVNAVGESLDTSAVASWAYQAPAVSSVTAMPLYLGRETTRTMGGAFVRIQASDDVDRVTVQTDSGQNETVRIRQGEGEVTMTLPVGDRTIRAVPVSQFQPPTGGANTGDQQSATVRVAGSPYFTSSGSLTATSNTSLRFTGVVPNANSSTQPTVIGYAVWEEGRSGPRCVLDNNDDLDRGDWQSSTDFTGLREYGRYRGAACVTNGYGVEMSDVVSGFAFADVPAGPTGLSYSVNTVRDGSSNASRVSWTRVTAPSPPRAPSSEFELQYRIGGTWSTTFALSAQQRPGTVAARYCLTGTSQCGTESTVAANTVPTTVIVQIRSSPAATPAATDLDFSSAVDSSEFRTVTVTPNPDTGIVTYHVEFIGEYSDLPPVDLTRSYTP